MNKAKQTEQKEIGRIRLSDNQDLVASLVDNEKLDLRVWMDTDGYKDPTKRGVRFYLFDGIWEKVFEILKVFNDEFEEMGKKKSRGSE